MQTLIYPEEFHQHIAASLRTLTFIGPVVNVFVVLLYVCLQHISVYNVDFKK